MNRAHLILLLLTILPVLVFAKRFEKRPQIIHIEDQFNLSKNWRQSGSSDREAIGSLIRFLKKSPTGKKILAQASVKAKKEGTSLRKILLVGEGSLTDTVLVRRFSPESPDEIEYSSRSKVFINKNLSFMNAVLDLAHELTHFVMRSAFNPYIRSFSLKEFISSTVEGRGGEVDAYLMECQVLLELFPKRGEERSSCELIVDQNTGELSKHRGIEQFYRVGAFYKMFVKKLHEHQISQNELTYISKEQANFISSAYGLPYPVAAIKEYETIMDKVCKNDMKRLAIMKGQMERAPSSLHEKKTQVTRQKAYGRLRNSHRHRCQSFY